ncbi:MAG: AMP-binding protein [Pseudomonadales bacterium]|nr:AMP-binding protein [Pseudomonadales bacterium]
MSEVISVPKSAINGILWPAISGGSSAGVLSILFQLQQSERWTPEQIAFAQSKQLHSVLIHCAKSVPAYSDILKAIEFKEDTPITAQQWHSLPILRRGQIPKLGSLLEATQLDASHGKTMEVHTSGSTGTPIKVKKTAIDQLFYMAFNLRDHFWHKRNFKEKFAMIRTFDDGVANYPEGGRQANWGKPYTNLYQTGESVGLAITATIEQQLDWLQREQPGYLLAFPSVIAGLAQLSIDKKTELPFLKGVSALGESVDDSVRKLTQQAWDLELVDMYSAQEVGYMALQCPDGDGYHVQSEGVFMEVLDDENKPCGPGQSGRIVVTPLHNFAMPLVRYEIGDYGEVGKPCSCGRGLPTLNRILGRTRNLLVLPDGSKLWPRLSELRYSDIVPVKQFQMVQKNMEHLEVKLVTGNEVVLEQEQQLKELINSRIGHQFDIVFSYPDEIPRSATGKYEDFRSEISEEN